VADAATGIARTFTAHARDYDALRRRLVPCFDAFYGAALDRVADWGVPPRARVLDLGAGTGLLAAMVKERWPAASVHLVDVSEGMLAEARARLGNAPGTSFEVADYATAPLGDGWDLVVSALSIHHLEDEAKRALLARVRDALQPGGLFVNAEQVLGPTPAAEVAYRTRWRAQAQALGATPDELAAAEARMRFDRCAPLDVQLGWLREAGFAEVDCVFKAWRFAVYAGERGLSPHHIL
jgi:SAM-dependent methyltransferase